MVYLISFYFVQQFNISWVQKISYFSFKKWFWHHFSTPCYLESLHLAHLSWPSFVSISIFVLLFHELPCKVVPFVMLKSVAYLVGTVSAISIYWMLLIKREWIILGCHFMINQFAGMLKPPQLYISAPSNRNLAKWEDLGAHTSNKNGL